MRKLSTGVALLLFLASHVGAEAPAVSLSYTEATVSIARVEILEGVSFDDAVESLKLRANHHNLKLVGSNALSKEIEALTGRASKRMEIFNFCDGLAAQQMVAANPLTISFMPCRIALVEGSDGKRWVVSMMMGDALINGLPADARQNAQRIMGAMKDMMIAASRGDL